MENFFDENPNEYNIVASVTPNKRSIDVVDLNDRSVGFTIKLHKTSDLVKVHFRKFSFNTVAEDEINFPEVKDLHDYVVGSEPYAVIDLGPLGGSLEKTITWDGIATDTGAYHGADVILPVIEMRDAEGNTHFHIPINSYYVPEFTISNFPIYGGGKENEAKSSVWQNIAHDGVFGSHDLIEPVILHHKLFPTIANQRPIIGETPSGDWIPFQNTESGIPIPWVETGSQWMETVGKAVEGDEHSFNARIKSFSVRRLPSASVAYLNQHANATTYSVESYESSAAHGEVSHAIFNLDAAADVTLTMFSPGGEEMPLFYRDDTGAYVNAIDVNCPEGENDIEFYAMDYTTPDEPKVLDNFFSDSSVEGHGFFQLGEVNGNPIGDREYRAYWRVKFVIKDQRTGYERVKWALVKVLK